MNKKYTLDMLNEYSVSVKTQDFLLHNNVEYEVGQPHRKAYVNSIRGREEVINELPLAQQNAIFSVWGDAPIIDETIAQ